MHYYNFHIGDYLSHTAHLSPEEDIAYRRLLDLYYQTESPIPNDIPWVSRRLRIDQKSIQTVLDEYFVLAQNGYINARADREIQEYRDFLEKQKANGIKGGRPRKNPKKPTANPSLTQGVTQTKPKITLTTNHKPLTNILDFELFWQTYPKRKSRGQAEKAWAKINPDEQLTSRIIDAVERAKTQANWQKENGQFIPYPATWLNAKGWEDESAETPLLKVAV